MIPRREQLLQLARLIGIDAFTERLGPPQTAEPDATALRTLIDERLEHIARQLLEEAVSSDDVVDTGSAEAYLDDRLEILAEALTAQQAERIRSAFKESTAAW